jgi:hypothetical protein
MNPGPLKYKAGALTTNHNVQYYYEYCCEIIHATEIAPQNKHFLN